MDVMLKNHARLVCVDHFGCVRLGRRALPLPTAKHPEESAAGNIVLAHDFWRRAKADHRGGCQTRETSRLSLVGNHLSEHNKSVLATAGRCLLVYSEPDTRRARL